MNGLGQVILAMAGTGIALGGIFSMLGYKKWGRGPEAQAKELRKHYPVLEAELDADSRRRAQRQRDFAWSNELARTARVIEQYGTPVPSEGQPPVRG